MLKIHIASDCGNAPKKQVIIDFNIAFAKGDDAVILSYLTDNIIWEMINDKTANGITEVGELVKSMSKHKADE